MLPVATYVYYKLYLYHKYTSQAWLINSIYISRHPTSALWRNVLAIAKVTQALLSSLTQTSSNVSGRGLGFQTLARVSEVLLKLAEPDEVCLPLFLHDSLDANTPWEDEEEVRMFMNSNQSARSSGSEGIREPQHRNNFSRNRNPYHRYFGDRPIQYRRRGRRSRRRQ